MFNYSQEKKLRKKAKEIIKKQKEKYSNVASSFLTLELVNFRKRYNEGENLSSMLVEAFAVVREMAFRKLKLSAYETQLMAAISVSEGKIVEMKTGEGKTLTIAFAAYLKAIENKSIHVVTVNDYLSKRDAEWIGPVYYSLGLKVGVLQDGISYVLKSDFDSESLQKIELEALNPESRAFKSDYADINKKGPVVVERSFNAAFQNENANYNLVTDERKNVYEADIIYGTNNEFGFDYLKDNMVLDKKDLVQQAKFNFAIIDEVDSVLIDEAQTPLIISQGEHSPVSNYIRFNEAIISLMDEDFVANTKEKTVYFTEKGIKKLEKILNINLYSKKTADLMFFAEMALRAHILFVKDKDYIIKDKKVIIIDEFTGRMMPGHKYAEGVHQAIEAKEGLLIGKESISLSKITLQNYFKLYKNFSGLTGTAQSAAEEFYETYKKEVVIIPTNKPVKRIDKPDLFYKDTEDKVNGILRSVRDANQKGQPVLLNTASVKNSEIYYKLLKKNGFNPNTLNAKYKEEEAKIIAKAGKKGVITVATDIAGRGTDISLDDDVRNIGGLKVISTERAISRRVDNQLIGRSGRQGDLGESEFHISLEDDLFRLYLSERDKKKIEKYFNKVKKEGSKNNKLSSFLLKSQRKAESSFKSQRTKVYEQDKVLDVNRKEFYRTRRKVLFDDDLGPEIQVFIYNEISRIVYSSFNLKKKNEWSLKKIEEILKILLPPGILKTFNFKDLKLLKRDDLIKDISKFLIIKYETEKVSLGDKNNINDFERRTILRILDALWIDYLKAMKYIENASYLVQYSKTDSLVYFRLRADKVYKNLKKISGEMIVKILFKTLFKNY